MKHQNFGVVEILKDNSDGTMQVQLASGEKRTVTTEFLFPMEPEAKPADGPEKP